MIELIEFTKKLKDISKYLVFRLRFLKRKVWNWKIKIAFNIPPDRKAESVMRISELKKCTAFYRRKSND